MMDTDRRRGFSLVELLVAVVIFGIVLAAVGSLLSGTLRFSSVSLASSSRIREVNDAAGYLADNVRRASSIAGSTSCTYSVLTGPCIGIVAPEATGAGGTDAIDSYVSSVFQVWPRAALDDDLKQQDSWADGNTWVLVEFRELLTCTGTCLAPPRAAAVDISNHDGPFVLLDLLDTAFFSGSVLDVLRVDGAEIEINVRVRSRSRSGEVSVPRDGAYSITTVARNFD